MQYDHPHSIPPNYLTPCLYGICRSWIDFEEGALEVIGHVVIIEHPVFMHCHSVALIVSATDKMVMAKYWHPKRGWSDEAKRRKTPDIIADLGQKDNLSPDDCNKAFSRIESWRAEAVERKKAAERSYLEKVKGISV